ncbi:MAG: alpha/beta hydrolase, partial [Lachnospiraceae bacterium]|nr:alpha/beta hydrolase [Lachnospiraceae bacterium]
DKYNSDKYCTYVFTINGYQTLFDALRYIQDEENIKKIPKELPVYVISGKDDPVGDYGKGVELVYESYKDAGLKDITMKLYDGARHELTNETNKEEVFDDVKAWLEAHLT